jgi:hypothetical protein
MTRVPILFGVLLAATVASAQLTIRPGQYEVTVDMKLGGVPAEASKAVLDAAGFQNQKRLECITADDVKGDMRAMFAREMEGSNCKMSDTKTTGNKMTFDITCDEDGIKMSGTTEIIFDGDSFSTLGTMKDNQGRVSTVRTMAKRVGDCK